MPAVGRASSKPKSLVDHLNDQAPKRPVNETVSISRYLMSAKLLLSQADQYRVIDDEEQLYVMLLRYASLVVETIPKHRDFSAGNPEYVSLKRDLLGRYLPELERLKASLKLKERPEPPATVSRNRPADAVQLSVSSLPQLNWSSSGAPAVTTAGSPGVGESGGSPSLKVDDLLEVMRSSPAEASSAGSSALALVPATGSSLGPGTAPPGDGSADPYALAAAASASLAAASGVTIVGMPQLKYSASYALSNTRHSLFGQASSARGADAQRTAQSAGPAASLPRYPALDATPISTSPAAPGSGTMAAVPDLAQLSIAGHPEQLALPMPHPSAGPSLGPQEVAVLHMPPSTAGLPASCSAHALQPPQPSAQPTPGGPKELVKRAQLRDVHVSVELMEEFLKYARSNTSRGIESCGILAGKLLAGDSTFAITTLIIPKQQGTTDTVQALNEEEIFEAQFERELYPMGWIHTHPTQTCFLSSVDVHTQCGYQTMLDEAVAIVMAPTDSSKRCGIFRLSTPGGLTLVQKCPNRGFHMHPPTDTGQELYELCGHVYLNPRTKYEVLDLR